MPPFSTVVAFALASLALVAIPGPSVLFVVGRSLALGRRGGLLSVVGNALGMLPQIAAVAVGVGAIVARSVVLFTVIKLAGAAYLIYLGIQAIRRRHHALGDTPDPTDRRTLGRLLREGFFVGLTNPKSIVFFVAVLPQFVAYDRGAIPAQILILGLVFLAVALTSDSIWALLAGSARTWFGSRPRRLSHMTTAGGLMMIGLGGTLAVAGHKD